MKVFFTSSFFDYTGQQLGASGNLRERTTFVNKQRRVARWYGQVPSVQSSNVRAFSYSSCYLNFCFYYVWISIFFYKQNKIVQFLNFMSILKARGDVIEE